MIKKILGILVLSLFVCLPVWSQQTGAAVTGHVHDPSGAVVAGAKVTAKSTTTGALYSAESNATGLYQLPFVPAGGYVFTVEKQGFRQYVQSGITLTVGQQATLNFKLQLGAVAQTVNVTANTPLLQTEGGSQNSLVTSARIAEAPLRGMNTIETTWFSPGVTVTSGARKLRPFDTGGSAGESINGGQSGQNLVLVDGISVAGSGASGSQFNPISDTVQEVNVQGTMYDAQYGWSTGGVVNTITKGGTNTWHGDAYEYIQNTIFNANTWGGNRTGVPRQPWYMNFFGGSVGGPIIHNKLFAFFAYQDIRQVQADPFVVSVPTAAMKSGDFSHVFAPGPSGQPVQQTIYDPLTTQCGGSPLVCTRQAFAGNIIPSGRLNPIAKAVLGYFPAPNAPGNPITGLGNLVNTSNSRKFLDIFPEYSGRMDFNYSDRTHMFFRYSTNGLAETRGYIYSTTSALNLADTSHNSPFSRSNQDFTFQITHSFNPTTVLQFRTGMNRFTTTSGSSISAGFNPGSLGFSSNFVSQAIKYFPTFIFSDYNGASTNPPQFEVQPTFTNELVIAKTHDKHNMKFGLQMMYIGDNNANPGYAAGAFIFSPAYTAATPLALTASSGNSIADLLLGYPDYGIIQKLNAPAVSERLWSLFFQDDYHMNSKFTLNLGMRWDYLGPLSDRFNALTRGFCSTCASPLQVPGMNLQGGLEFAGVGSNPRGIYNPRYSNFDPRIGFAYRLEPNTVIRGGYGMVYGQVEDNPGGAPGFSQTTVTVFSPVLGVPNPAWSLANPFPNGILTSVGSSQGLATNLGEGISFADPDMNIPRVQQYSLQIQHQFASNWLASIAYVGSRTSRLPVSRSINYLPLQALQLGVAALTKSVANPFLAVPTTSPYYQQIQSTFLASKTLQEQQLLLPYPQFGGITEGFIPIGRARYNSLQAELTKRLSMGLDFNAAFTWSKNMDDNTFLNPTDPQPSWYIDPNDSTRQFKLSAVWFLPMGPGKRFASTSNPVLSRIIGGWSTSAQLRLEDGRPMQFPSGVAPTGNKETIPNQSLNRWFNTCTQTPSGLRDCEPGEQPAWVTVQPLQLVTWSPYLSRIRWPWLYNLDMSVAKTTTIKERYALKLRADFINATNSLQWYGNPNINASSGTFGHYADYTNPSNDMRVIMLSLRFQF